MHPSFLILTLLIGLALPPFGAGAAESGGLQDRPAIAMHGQPLYPEGFDHIPGIDPGVPVDGLLRRAVIGRFDSLHPFIVRGQAAAGLTLVTEPLMARGWDEPFTLYGLLAELVSVAADRSQVTFTLNPRARWHDGRPVTVDDVRFSYETLRYHGRPPHRTYYGQVATVATKDRSITFTFAARPDGSRDRELPLILGLMSVLPAHVWAGRDFDQPTLVPPLGSGPYRVAAVDPGRSITYRRVPDYWGADLPVRRGHSNFETVRFDYYRDDSVAYEAFNAGQIDLWWESSALRWQRLAAMPAAVDGRIRMESLPHGRPEPVRGVILNTRRPLFADVRVREALALAFDGAWINRALLAGAGRRTESYYPNSVLAARGVPSAAEMALLQPFAGELPPRLFTEPFHLPSGEQGGPAAQRPALLRAKALLEAAGWRVRDGRLRNTDGHEFRFEILLGDPGEERIVLAYVRGLARLGIAARVRTVDSAQFQARLDGFDYDTVVHQWVSSLSPGNEQLVYYGSPAAGQPGSRNYPGIRSLAVDTMAASLAASETYDELVARARALDRVLSWGFYLVPFFYQAEDRIAVWQPLCRPARIPLYGVQLESWWTGTCKRE